MTKDDVVFSKKFSLVVTREDTMHALVAYFSISFTRTEKEITLSTGPFDAPTCWKQVFFYLKRPVEARVEHHVIVYKLVFRITSKMSRFVMKYIKRKDSSDSNLKTERVFRKLQNTKPYLK